jgi:hypothetical protein
MVSRLAGLQGIESKCKKVAASFGGECQQQVAALEAFLDVEPNKLYTMDAALLRATLLFHDGGDYSEKEEAELREQLRQLERAIASCVAKRRGVIGRLQARQTEALSKLESFHHRYDECLQELSLREGLGMKYGAPRRNAQEKLRTEQTRDEAGAARIDQLLSALDQHCAAVAAARDDPEGYAQLMATASKAGTISLSVRAICAVFC